MRTAHLLTQVAPRYPTGALPIPGVTPGIRVYARKKLTSYLWERPYLEAALSSAEVRANGAKYLLALELSHFTELIDLRPPKGSPFIHSMSEPFSEDDVDAHVMHNWLKHFGLTFHQMHASGHASGPELVEIIRATGAKTVYPIHTIHPEALETTGPSVRPPGARPGLPSRRTPLTRAAAEGLRRGRALGGRWHPTDWRPGSPRSTGSSVAGWRPTRSPRSTGRAGAARRSSASRSPTGWLATAAGFSTSTPRA